jgi:hypothetical protein
VLRKAILQLLVGLVGDSGIPMYNPSQPIICQFLELLIGLVTPTSPPTSLPFSQTTIPLGAPIMFWLHQPNLHFVNSHRERGLSVLVPMKDVAGEVDLDSLVKFILDTRHIDSIVLGDDGRIFPAYTLLKSGGGRR